LRSGNNENRLGTGCPKRCGVVDCRWDERAIGLAVAGEELPEERRTEMRLTTARTEAGVGAEIGQEKAAEFWAGKTPCWEICQCPQMIQEECPAPKYTSLPCWEIEGTYCKLDDYGTTGRDISICQLCRVYKRYGGGKPIELKLFGKGIDTSFKSLDKLVEKQGAGK